MAESVPSRQFRIRLEGESDDAQYRLSDLIRAAGGVESMLRGIATVISRERTDRPGRVRRFIEEATAVRVVAAPREGSLVIPLELPPEPARLDETIPDLDIGPDLGQASLDCLIGGLGEITGDTDKLPHGFDRRVLRRLEQLRPSLNRGISSVTIEKVGTMGGKARIDRDRIEAAHRLIHEPVRGPATIEGKLEMVDRSKLACRIDRVERPDVLCSFPETLRDAVTDSIGQYVRVSGEGSFQPGRDDPDRLDAESLQLIQEELQFDAAAFGRNPSVDELAEEQGIESSEALLALGPLEWLDDDEAEALHAAARSD